MKRAILLICFPFMLAARLFPYQRYRWEKGVAIKEDKMSIVLSFEDGSVGTVNYFGNGSKSYPKETLEIFSEGRILRLDNFKKVQAYGFKGFRKFNTLKMDKGHQAQFNIFTQRIKDGGEPVIPFNEIINSTLASFAAVTSANEYRTINLRKEYSDIYRGLNKEI